MRFIIILFCLLPIVAYGQHLQGKVVDANRMPVENANIINSSSGSHAHTNALGIFYLSETDLGDTLLISHVGYTNYTTVVSDQEKELEVQLKESPIELEQLVITTRIKALNQIAAIDLKTNPVNSSQEILMKVPGLFIGQHAGGGKAEQIFLRGFDIDHGTDISLSADGLPVNMVSHAHGQGYADLHFLIPETIRDIDYDKGPYHANKGNFATAGYVDFHTFDRIDKSRVTLEYGSFNRMRTVGLFNLLGDREKHGAYIASEYLLSDGPFQTPQNFKRLNLMGKYTGNFSNNQHLTLQASFFDSKWDASGQIPQRAVEQGIIGRFGAIDNTEGGYTKRVNILAKHTSIIDERTFVMSKVFYAHYNFELYSNFTFFLNDPINGDQIRQKENRGIAGLESVLHKNYSLPAVDIFLQSGVGFRYDDINDHELSHTKNRKNTLNHMSLGDVDESNSYGFIHAELDFGHWLINPAVRLDYFKFNFVNHLDSTYNALSESKAIVSPKLNIIYSPTRFWQLYLKSGIGFHSNDTRVVVAQNGREILPAAYGTDLGTILKPTDKLMVNAALWYLFLEQEFVYVGDEGIVEPKGKTRRKGIDVGIRYQPFKWLFLDADVNYAYARAVDESEGRYYIPLAPNFTSTGGFSLLFLSGFTSAIRYRYLNDRPANEDNTVVASGYFVTDVNVNYTYKNWNLGVVIENFFNTDWNETQFETESRLSNEMESVSEIHFTPGTPFSIRAKMVVSF